VILLPVLHPDKCPFSHENCLGKKCPFWGEVIDAYDVLWEGCLPAIFLKAIAHEYRWRIIVEGSED